MEMRTSSDDKPIAVWLTQGGDRASMESVTLVFHQGTDKDRQQITLQGKPADLMRMLQRVQQTLGRMGGCSPRQDTKTVYIQVTGGGAYVQEKPLGVAVVVQDFDIEAGDGTVVRVYPAEQHIRRGHAARKPHPTPEHSA